VQGNRNDTTGGHLSGGTEVYHAKLAGKPVYEPIFEAGASRVPSRSDKQSSENLEDGKGKERKNRGKEQRR
jgi:hypothetical protein